MSTDKTGKPGPRILRKRNGLVLQIEIDWLQVWSDGNARGKPVMISDEAIDALYDALNDALSDALQELEEGTLKNEWEEPLPAVPGVMNCTRQHDVVSAKNRRRLEAEEAEELPTITEADEAPLPLPTADGGPDVPFGDAVDAYVHDHGVSRAECFRRISAVTGNAVNGLALRYSDRGGSVWRFSSPN